MKWDPDQYLKYAGPRLRPAMDLLSRLEVVQPQSIVDLGCGSGNITQILHRRWPQADVTGVDSSAEMLEQARAALPKADWVEQSLDDWQPGAPVDLIYSNAALHWLENHEDLFPSLIQKLVSGGTLAIQMPRNFGAPSHTAVTDVARNGPWAKTLRHLINPAPVQPPEYYHALLGPLVADLDIWETEYLHVLEGDDPVVEWTKGTWLRPFLAALEPEVATIFEANYKKRLRAAYPPNDRGQTLFPFRRLFIVARR